MAMASKEEERIYSRTRSDDLKLPKNEDNEVEISHPDGSRVKVKVFRGDQSIRSALQSDVELARLLNEWNFFFSG